MTPSEFNDFNVGNHSFLKVLSDRHREIARRLVAGQSHFEIGEALNLSPEAIRLMEKNSPNFSLYKEELHKAADFEAIDVNARIREGAALGAELLLSILKPNGNSGDKEAPLSMQVKVAMDLLDRDGYVAVKRTDIRVAAMQLTGEDIARLAERAKQANPTHGTGQVVTIREEVAKESVCSEEERKL